VITAANAAALAAKAQESRRNNKALRLLLPADADVFDRYVLAELVRMRTHIDRLHAQIAACSLPQDIERLYRALNLASERERLLAGRPTPGQLRPDKVKLRSAATSMSVLPLHAASTRQGS